MTVRELINELQRFDPDRTIELYLCTPGDTNSAMDDYEEGMYEVSFSGVGHDADQPISIVGGECIRKL